MLGRRLATAAVGIPVAVVTVWAGGWAMAAVAGAVVAVGAWEFYHLSYRAGYSPSWLLGTLGAGALPLAAQAGSPWALAAVSLVVLAAMVAELCSRRGRPLANAAGAALGTVYVGLFGAHWVLLRQLPEGMAVTFLVLASTWCADSAAYFVGRWLGRRKLAPQLSPNKTVEGALGGVFGGLVGAGAAGAYFGLPVLWVMVGGLVCTLSGQLGDLWESALKREAQAKDSGWVVPGHGGVLDRFDGLLFSGVVAYYVFAVWTGAR
ncbi:MAG: phosphatidate cytidylyltransferase [candidate division GAL15 bacterium]